MWVKKTFTVLLFGLVCTSGITAAELALDQPVENGYRKASDPVIITLGENIPKDSFQYLRLEIDAIDVTEFITFQNGKLLYSPQIPFTTGEHVVRLVAVLPDGNIEEIANWQMVTKASQYFTESSVQSNLDIELSQRIVDNYTGSDNPGVTQAQGSYVLYSEQSTEDWRLTSQADFIYNSQRDQTANGNELDLNEYSLKSEWSQSSVIVGHQVVPVSSLVMTDFNRRGVSANYHSESNDFEVAGFATRTEQITGYENIFGLSNHAQSTSGAYLRSNPVSGSPESLIVTGVLLNGKGSAEGQAEAGDDGTAAEGDASAIIVESYLGNKKVYLRGEYAQSSFDFDGVNTGYDAAKDNAESIYIQYATERNEQRDESHNWSLGYLQQKIGQWFYSLGNAALPADKVSHQLIASFVSDDWQVNANTAVEENNVESNPFVPVVETNMFSTNITYTPVDSGESTPTGIFTNPSYAFAMSESRSKQVTTPTGYTGDTVDFKNSETSFLVSFSGDNWNWGLSHTISKEEDLTDTYSDSENHSSSVEASVPVNDKISISPVIQTTTTRYTDGSYKSTTDNYSVALQYSNLDDLSLSASYSTSFEKSSDDLINTETNITELMANWIQQQAEENRFGFSYFMRASYQDLKDSGVNTSTYQAYLGINITWPANF